MTEYSVVRATSLDLMYVAAKMRPDDVREVWAMVELAPAAAIERSARVSRETMAGLVDGEPVCIFGVGDVSLISGIGAPWMLAIPLLEDHAIPFLRRSRKYVRELFSNYRLLENYVDARNVKAVQWLRWLGFRIEPATPAGVHGEMFHRFWKENA